MTISYYHDACFWWWSSAFNWLSIKVIRATKSDPIISESEDFCLTDMKSDNKIESLLNQIQLASHYDLIDRLQRAKHEFQKRLKTTFNLRWKLTWRRNRWIRWPQSQVPSSDRLSWTLKNNVVPSDIESGLYLFYQASSTCLLDECCSSRNSSEA